MKKKIMWSIAGTVLLLLLMLTVYLIFFRQRAGMVDCSMYYPYEEMLQRSTLVVRGKVVGKSGTVCKDNGDGDDLLYTDYYLSVSHVLRGEAKVGDKIAVRMDGGASFTQIVDCSTCPVVHKGDDAVAFLYRPGEEAYEEDYYRLLCGENSWYTTEDGETFMGFFEDQPLSWKEISVDIPNYGK